MEILMFVLPALLGFAALTYSGKCRGKNARSFFQLGGWGFLLTYLRFLHVLPLPDFLGWVNSIVMLVPSAFCFVAAANAIVREMRAQKNGEYTEVA
jgi:hypothetical protein